MKTHKEEIYNFSSVNIVSFLDNQQKIKRLKMEAKAVEKMEVDLDQEEAGSSNAALKIADQKSQAGAGSSKTVIFAAPSTVPSVSVSLHPLVLMNISEHWTRIRAQAGAAREVYGGLIGKQKGRKIEVLNSFELKFEVIDDDVIINKDYYNTKEEQCKFQVYLTFPKYLMFSFFQLPDKQVFSDLDFLGWYTTTGTGPTEKHIKVHRQICSINECPILLQLDPNSKKMDVSFSLIKDFSMDLN